MLTVEMITPSVRRDLVRFAKSRGLNPTDAEDQVQDALICAWEKKESYHAGSDLLAWLKRFVHSETGHHKRADERNAQAIQDFTDWTGRPDSELSEEHRAMVTEELGRTIGNIACLPPKQRAAIMTSLESDKPLDEATQKSLERARAALREAL